MMRVPRLFRLLVPSLGMLRLSVYLFCVCSALCLLAARAVYANMKEGALALGRQLGSLSEYAQTAETVLLNGTRLHHGRATTTASVTEVLDRAETLCTESPGLLTQVMDEATTKHPSAMRKAVPLASWRRAVVRHESDEDGMVLCFAGGHHRGLAGLTEAMQRFRASADLKEFGNLRYVYVQRRKDGKSRVALYWTNSSLSLPKMFPTAGDAQGTDSRVLPRPPASRRTLSAGVEGRPYALRVYETSLNPRQARTFYNGWMSAHGWEIAATSERDAAVAYSRNDGYQAFVSFAQLDDAVQVSLSEAASVIGSVHVGN